MSFVDELERAIMYPATIKNGRWFAKHGPRLLAAVRLAEDVTKDKAGANTTNVYTLAKAYRTACAGDSETGRLNKEKP